MDFNNFSVQPYGELTKISNVLSKCRVRVFYKYGNRNGSYISDEFAEKLIKTAPYTPLKGIWDNDTNDFTDHGLSSQEGRIYGIVPENPNFAWEDHPDEVGIIRTFACFDVFLFTALYGDQLEDLYSKPQSMELYRPSIVGSYKVINGQEWFVFEDACWLGFQILGEETEPCFEGSGFFSCEEDKNTIFKLIKEIKFQLSTGGEVMNNDEQTVDSIEVIEAAAEVENTVDTGIETEVVEEVTESTEETVIETSAEAAEPETYSLVLSKEEFDVLNAFKALNNDTFENIDTVFADMQNKISEYELKIVEFENNISTLKQENENAANLIESLNSELTDLQSYKLNVERQEKQVVLDSYSSKLSSDILDEFTTNMDNYTKEELEKELAYKLVKTNPSAFSLNIQPEAQILPKDVEVSSGAEALLRKYTKS